MPLRRKGEKAVPLDGDPRFWCVTCYFNSKNDLNRRNNYEYFAKQLKKQKVNLFTVELCTSESETGLPKDLSTQYLRRNHPDVLWSKEALLNIAIDALPPQCEYVCWIDADVVFLDDEWVNKCIDALQKHPVVQPFDQSVFLNKGERPWVIPDKKRHMRSFAAVFSDKAPLDYRFHHPGLAWAARRDVLKATHGLYTKNIMSLAEVMMAYAFTCPSPETISVLWDPRTAPHDLLTNTRLWSPPLCHDVQRWQQQASVVTGGDLGVTRGVTAYHLWHGSALKRNYQQANEIISEYDPNTHVCIDADGLLVWSDSAPKSLKQKVDSYFTHRKS